ncbi:bordetella uptake gene family protein [Shewanella sp. NFH-SH190041]|uniref:Bug family tripartite tricarboxylate transporter substrate binding protein n=1 Tax=Shewanella sp. NFH-SH190041 TaxID=2950245 RepID=UPI0021C2EC48|nr:tripartite tricarboxylate transporter substrate-binding protein [Shewanella sp. NFH-SH190041]BDM64076.1 bordetella uptake gene family protein [Shewanella sp. NFH-SH190041]
MKRLTSLLAGALLATASGLAQAEIHFLIPGGPGGGWDTTARGVGEALVKAELVDNASFENMSGGGGGRAIAHLIEAKNKPGDILMVNSTPIVLRALNGRIPFSYRDLTPVAGMIADFGAFVVRNDSPLQSWQDVLVRFKANPHKFKVGGGSARGSMDHLVAAQAVSAAGLNGAKMRYIPYDGGGQAKAGLLSGEADILSTGFSEALEIHNSGQGRILAITADQPVSDYPDIPTIMSLGYDMSFVNWRGFFAAPGISAQKVDGYIATLEKLLTTPQWEQVRSRNGWRNLFLTKEAFVASLEAQEQQLKTIMLQLGFIREG